MRVTVTLEMYQPFVPSVPSTRAVALGVPEGVGKAIVVKLMIPPIVDGQVDPVRAFRRVDMAHAVPGHRRFVAELPRIVVRALTSRGRSGEVDGLTREGVRWREGELCGQEANHLDMDRNAVDACPRGPRDGDVEGARGRRAHRACGALAGADHGRRTDGCHANRTGGRVQSHGSLKALFGVDAHVGNPAPARDEGETPRGGGQGEVRR